MHDADELDPRIQCSVIHNVKYIFGSHFPPVLIVYMMPIIAQKCVNTCHFKGKVPWIMKCCSGRVRA